MMDEGDYGADYQARHNAEAVSRHRSRMELAAGAAGSEVCEECGDEIPAARRAAMPGCSLCVACMTDIEKRRGVG